MLILDESKVAATLNQDGQHTVYQYIDEGSFIVKALDMFEVDQNILVDFNLEFDILAKLDIPEVPGGVCKARYCNRPALRYNYIEGQNLLQCNVGKWTVEKFLPVAIAISDVLAKIHQQNIVHNDINPENVILGKEGKVYIIDFSSATRLSSRNVAVQSPSQIQGSIAYMSPEAFGRMNRHIDSRSDLYSIGVMFYELLLGKLPFISKDPLELIHFHMAKKPDLSGVPSILGEILGKLMAKTPELRYQSALGLRHDLLQCQELLGRFGQILDFPIATKDNSSTFRIPQKLYGRDQEITQLLEKFNYVADGNSHLLLVSGYSGIGKTALLNEIHKPVTQRKGYFLTGKFDQFQRDVPYYALIRAFDQFIDQLLKESKSFIDALREEILEAIGSNGQLIIDVIPAIKLIIGSQPDIKPLPPTEAQNRFLNTFLSFIKLFGKKEHPLVIMGDDLQWSDQASLELFSNLLSDENTKHILIIGAYRSNEVDANHPLILALDKLKNKTDEISAIELYPLNPADVLNLVADTLKTTPEKAQGISELIYEKTNGNPFFVAQFLNRLYDDELIRFDFEKLSWQWEVQVIRAMEITDNVVELMMKKLQQLPPSTKEIIRLGACVGNTFDLNTIASISQKDKLSIASELWPSVQAGLLLPEGDNYKMSQINQEIGSEFAQIDLNVQYQFAHDRIQQAAYALIPEGEREGINLSIGRLLLSGKGEKVESALFEIMGHINAGKKLIKDRHEGLKYAQLNLKAGKKAKRSLAYESSLVYLSNGIDLLPDDCWQQVEMYPVIYELCLEKAEASYLTGAYDEAEATADTILQHATSESDKARVYLLKGLLNTTIGRLVEALDAIKHGLKIFGLEVPDTVDQALIIQNLTEIERFRASRSISDLFNLQDNQSQVSYMKILLLAIGATPAFFLDKSLWVWVLTQMVQVSIEDGNTDISDLGYSAFGLFIGSSLGQYTEGYEYGMLALRLNKKYNKIENLAKIGVIFGQLVSPWKVHIRENIIYAREGFQAGIETGDLIYAGYCAAHLSWDLFLLGTPLQEVTTEVDKLLKFFEKSKDGMGYAARVVKKMSVRLQEENLSVVLGKNPEDENQFVHEMQVMHNAMPITTYYISKMRLYYYAGDFASTIAQMPLFLKHMHSTLGSAFNSDAYFFHSLAIIEQVRSNPDVADKVWLEHLQTNINQLKTWSTHAPMNFGYRYHLVLAEKAHFIDKDMKIAEEYYDVAINLANEHGFIHDEALCAELAGRFYLEHGRKKIAKTYLNDAVTGYQRWGAYAVANQLVKKYRNLLSSQHLEKEGDLIIKSTGHAGKGRGLDWSTLLKATSIISGEMVLEQLLDKFMHILIENAGAQKCFIIYRDDNTQTFFIEAEASIDLEENKILHHEPLEGNTSLSEEIIHYVHRTGKTLVLDDVKKDNRFNNTNYIIKSMPKSILATNVVMQNRPSAVIYMENNLATAAFSDDRVEFIRILATQVSISLENALVYRDLEEKVNNRTLTIEKQKEIISLEKNKSDDLLYNILPKATADELKAKGSAAPKYFEEVTILFTDFIGFTKITENLSPEELIESLNQCFLAFDEIAEKNHLEKIKTIGDSYMCAAGVPVPDKDHAINAIKAGLQIQSFIKKWNYQREQAGRVPWPLRLGIDSGPVIAGVVGMRKFAYDIWGDAVNIAARMESAGGADKVNISASTYALVKDLIDVEYRGKLVAKNKGKVDMFFVTGLK